MKIKHLQKKIQKSLNLKRKNNGKTKLLANLSTIKRTPSESFFSYKICKIKARQKSGLISIIFYDFGLILG